MVKSKKMLQAIKMDAPRLNDRMHLVFYSGSEKSREKGFSGIESRRGGDCGDCLCVSTRIRKIPVPELGGFLAIFSDF